MLRLLVWGTAMLRLGKFIPIVMVAVLVQFFAPVFAIASVANAYADPLGAAVICSGDHDGTSSAADHTTCCAVCAVGLGTPASLDAPPQVFVALQRDYLAIVWLEASETPAAIRIGSNAQARAPPFYS